MADYTYDYGYLYGPVQSAGLVTRHTEYSPLETFKMGNNSYLVSLSKDRLTVRVESNICVQTYATGIVRQEALTDPNRQSRLYFRAILYIVRKYGNTRN